MSHRSPESDPWYTFTTAIPLSSIALEKLLVAEPDLTPLNHIAVSGKVTLSVVVATLPPYDSFRSVIAPALSATTRSLDEAAAHDLLRRAEVMSEECEGSVRTELESALPLFRRINEAAELWGSVTLTETDPPSWSGPAN